MSARSRLRADFGPQTTAATTSTSHQPAKPIPRQRISSGWLGHYLHRLPAFGMGLVMLTITWVLFSSVQPQQIRDLPLPHSYGPLIVSVFLSSFWLAGFIMQHARRGLGVACLVSGWLFLRLHHMKGAEGILIGAIVVFGIIELLLWSWRRFNHRGHSTKQHHDHH